MTFSICMDFNMRHPDISHFIHQILGSEEKLEKLVNPIEKLTILQGLKRIPKVSFKNERS